MSPCHRRGRGSTTLRCRASRQETRDPFSLPSASAFGACSEATLRRSRKLGSCSKANILDRDQDESGGSRTHDRTPFVQLVELLTKPRDEGGQGCQECLPLWSSARRRRVVRPCLSVARSRHTQFSSIISEDSEEPFQSMRFETLSSISPDGGQPWTAAKVAIVVGV
jgi:hypothetical protein